MQSEGGFIFRFKYKVNDSNVWLDLTNRKCKVPKVDAKIILKVTRKNAKYLEEPSEVGVEESKNDVFTAMPKNTGLEDFVF